MTNFLSFVSGVGVALFGGKLYTMIREKLDAREAATTVAGERASRRNRRHAPYTRDFQESGEVICMSLPRHPMPRQWKMPKSRIIG